MDIKDLSQDEVLILIPARYASVRFPNKPLSLIAGKTMIERVYRNAHSSGFQVKVVTDHPQISEHVLSFGGEVWRVDDEVACGTDRIYLAYKRFANHKYKLIINLQGDEPLLQGSELRNLAYFHISSPYSIATLVKKHMHPGTAFNNPSVVKVIYDEKIKTCHYFSRAAVPHSYNTANSTWFQHIGIYSYYPEVLCKFVESPPSFYEQVERLEQLRALSLGFSIGGALTESNLIAVDTPEDIPRVEAALNNAI